MQHVIFLLRKVSSKDRFLAKEIALAPLLDVDFWYYEFLTNV